MIYVIVVCGILAIIAVVFAVIFHRKVKFLLEKNDFLTSSLNVKDERISALENDIDNLNAENRVLVEDRANLKTALEYETKISEEKLQEFRDFKNKIEEQSRNEFKILSQTILEEKLKKHKEIQEENLGTILKPLQRQIETFKKRVDEIHSDDIKERSTLINEIKHLKDLNIKISQDAINLTNALKGNNKTQGNWGEMILEKLLEDSGLIKDREYIVQESYKNEDGNILRPDVVIKLPNNKKIIIDSKVSLVDYERFISKTSENLEDLSIHIISLKNHIKELSKKNYESLLNSYSLDFILMFVPIEGAFLDALRFDNELFSYAYNKNIILVSPTTLLATLRTIGNIWRNERQNSNMQEILDVASGLYDKFSLFYKSMESIGSSIDSMEKIYKNSLKQLKDGRGSLYSRIQKLDELGIKVKNKLPSE